MLISIHIAAVLKQNISQTHFFNKKKYNFVLVSNPREITNCYVIHFFSIHIHRELSCTHTHTGAHIFGGHLVPKKMLYPKNIINGTCLPYYSDFVKSDLIERSLFLINNIQYQTIHLKLTFR